MNITLNKPTATRSVIAISVKEGDYQPSIDLKLKEIARETSMPGFRPGKVPTGVLQKKYGKTLLIEKVNSLVSESLTNYIKEQNLRIVGEPLPIHDIGEWDTQKDFDFEFEVGLIEDFTIDLSPAVSIPQYIVVVDEPMIDMDVDALRKRHFVTEYPEVSQAGDTLTGDIEMEGQEKKTVCMPLELFSDEEVKPFLGLKVNEKNRLEVAQLPESERARANILVLPIEEVKAVAGGSFTLTIDTISRPKPAELNEEFFAAAFPGSEIKTEEEFRAKVKEALLAESEKDSLFRLGLSIQEYFTKHTSMTLPEEFLRKLIKWKNPTISEESLEKEVARVLEQMKWGVIVGMISRENHFKAEQEELFEYAKRSFLRQLGIADGSTLPHIDFTSVINKYLYEDKTGQNYSMVHQQVLHYKVINFIREKITHDKKEVNMEEYKRIVEGTNSI